VWIGSKEYVLMSSGYLKFFNNHLFWFFNFKIRELSILSIYVWRKIVDETLTSSIKQNTQQKGKQNTKKKDPSWDHKCKPKMDTKGQRNTFCSKVPINRKKHIMKKREGKHEIIVNLKELSWPTTMLCFKIKVACIICKIANTFYL
jgi:hypothetical protein